MLKELTVAESRQNESEDGHHKGNGDCCRQHPNQCEQTCGSTGQTGKNYAKHYIQGQKDQPLSHKIHLISNVRKFKWSRTGHINRLKDDRWTSRVALGDHMTRKDDTGDQPSGGQTTWTNTGGTRSGRGQLHNTG